MDGSDLKVIVDRAAAEGPQAVEQDGEVVAVVLSNDEYRSLRRSNAKDDLISFFQSWPSLEDVDLRRDRDGSAGRRW
jgi:hypothetical protein